MTKHRGFSTVGKRFGNFVYEDKELAKRDLTNHFYTRKGERLAYPDFGSILPSLIFEQLDQFITDEVEDDVRAVVAFDPRWILSDLRIEIGDNSITCRLDLIYSEDGTADELYLKFIAE